MKKPVNFLIIILSLLSLNLLPINRVWSQVEEIGGSSGPDANNDDPDDPETPEVPLPGQAFGYFQNASDNDFFDLATVADTFEIDIIGLPGFPPATPGYTIEIVSFTTAARDTEINTITLADGEEFITVTGIFYSVNFIKDNPGSASAYVVNFVEGDGITGNGVAPVEWLSFDAEALAEGVRLRWSTATEENNQGFGIERSRDAQRWETLEFVPGAGSTQDIQEYTFMDFQPDPGFNYYRLKQTDYNGDYEYSDIREVVVGIQAATHGVSFFPNPVKNQLHISPMTGTVSVHDLSGRRMRMAFPQGNWYTLELSALPAGMYILTYQPLGGAIEYSRFLKN